MSIKRAQHCKKLLYNVLSPVTFWGWQEFGLPLRLHERCVVQCYQRALYRTPLVCLQSRAVYFLPLSLFERTERRRIAKVRFIRSRLLVTTKHKFFFAEKWRRQLRLVEENVSIWNRRHKSEWENLFLTLL